MNLLIPVVYKTGKFTRVPPRELDELIRSERIVGFRRSGGWAVIGEDPVRQHGGSAWHEPERRRAV